MNLSREELLSRLRDMNGHQFEKLIADIWEERGWETTVTTGSGDDGIDIIVEKDSPFNPNQKHVIQAKCYSDTSVGGPELRDFGGAIDLADADAGVFLTTSSFSSSAERTADGLSSKLNLVNGEDLCDLILDLENPQQFLSEYIDTDSNSVNEVDSEFSVDDIDSSGPSTYENPKTYRKHQPNKTGPTDNTQSDTNVQTNETKSVDNTKSDTGLGIVAIGIVTIGIVGIIMIFTFVITPAEVGETQEFGGYTIAVEKVYTTDTIQSDDVGIDDGTYKISDMSDYNLQEAESSDAERFLIIVVEYEQISDNPDDWTYLEVTLGGRYLSLERMPVSSSNPIQEIYINGKELDTFYPSETLPGVREGAQEMIVFAVPDKDMSGKTLEISAEHTSAFASWEISNVSEY